MTGSVDRVAQALEAAGYPSNIKEFPAGTKTAADAAASIGCTVAQIAKSLIFRIDDRPLLVIASGVNRVSLPKIETLLGKKISRADAAWVREVTGFAIGGVAPVGHETAPLVILDADLQKLEPLWAAAGSPSHVFETTAEALVSLTSARVADIKED
jgi:prolyl-tRNA editing enzyme YbaK/EbsC (Cys-tRNA(Pro) deacylase)